MRYSKPGSVVAGTEAAVLMVELKGTAEAKESDAGRVVRSWNNSRLLIQNIIELVKKPAPCVGDWHIGQNER